MNVKLTYPPIQVLRKFKSQVTVGGVCKNITQETTEILPPFDCAAGDRMILFLKQPAFTADGSGVVVGSIITRDYVAGSYDYYVDVPAALLATGVHIDQCDVLKACCFDCVAEYLCRLMAYPNCPAIKDCVGGGMSDAMGLHYDALAKLFNVAISQSAGNNITQLADGIFATTTEESAIDSTMMRDTGGILGVANNPLAVNGHFRTFGIDDNGAGIRIPEVSAIATMDENSVSHEVAIPPSTYVVADYNVIDFDPLGMITPGADWHIVIPVSGRYLLSFAAVFSNTAWGGFGVGNFAYINLGLTIDAGPQIFLGSRTMWDRDQAQLAAPHVSITRLFNLTAGMVLRPSVQHTDNNQPNDTHSLVQHPSAYISIHRIL